MSLTSAGERQAAAAGERLARAGVQLVHTSPRRRARQTAEAIGARTGASVEIVAALDEIDFGEWTGRSYAELEDDLRWREWNARRGSARCPGGESMEEAADRAHAHAAGLARSRPGARIALVAHADVLRGLVARVLGLPLDNLLSFEIAPATISRIEMGDWGGCVHSLNEVPAPDLPEPERPDPSEMTGTAGPEER